MLTIHRYYQQQLVLRTGQMFFCWVLLVLAWILIVRRGTGERQFYPSFHLSWRKWAADCGIDLGKADWKQTESIDDTKIQLEIKRPLARIYVHPDTHFLVIRHGSLHCLDFVHTPASWFIHSKMEWHLQNKLTLRIISVRSKALEKIWSCWIISTLDPCRPSSYHRS